ncbi:MAG TPA: PKD domain-containing protein, partial [Tepidisphaeraceae bacterium]|nr:PKD domain-containing protein [Tepidisphaeraceae bacterium]
MESLEQRTLLSVSIINGGGSGYVGDAFPGDGGDPPDTCGAAGPSSYIESTNAFISIFTPKASGTSVVTQGPGSFFFSPSIGNETQIDAPGSGGAKDPGSAEISDVTVQYDNLIGRFILGDIDVDQTTNVSQYVFAVSTSNDPTTLTTADWNFYHITTTEGSGSSTSWSDYPGNSGYNADAFVETFNMFGAAPNDCQVVSVNATDLANGVPQASLHFFKNDVSGGAQNYRPTTMQDSVPGDPMWLVHNPDDGSTVDVVKMTNVLSNSASFSTTSLSLPAADQFNPLPVSPENPDSSLIQTDANDQLDGASGNTTNASSKIDDRILKASEYNNIVVATDSVPVGNAFVAAASLQLDSMKNPIGGSGYSVGDTLTVSGGTFTTAATLKVTSVTGSGGVATVTVAIPGNYSNTSGITGAVTGGTGSGAMFNFRFGGQRDAEWFAFNVSGGTPAFQLVGGGPNLGLIGFGANTYCVYPGIGINAAGEIGLSFTESDTVGGAANPASGGFVSTFVTARLPTDPAGTMDPVVLVPAGTGYGDIGDRAGDFSGLNVDPVNGTFWAANQFGVGSNPMFDKVGDPADDIVNFTPEAPPMVTPPTDQMAVEGAPKSINLGSFTDPDGSPWTVKVDWGDGSQDSFSIATAGPLGSLTHTYAEEGNYSPKVTVTDNTLLSGSATFNVAVSDPAVIPTGGFLVTGVEGANSGAQTVATFTDPGGPEVLGDYSATIKWGDGNITSGIITFSGGVFTVQGADTYGEEGIYAITVTLHHETASDAMTTSIA